MKFAAKSTGGLALCALSAIMLLAADIAQAQTKYPTKPITIIVPFAPGGSSDLVARVFAKASNKHFGQPMVILNKPGAAMQIGLNELAASKPDGYTVGITNSGMLLQPLLSKTQYNYATDLDGVAMAGEIPFVLAVKSDAPYKTLEEFVTYAKANPGKVKYGHTGIGSSSHTPLEQFALAAKLNIESVPYDGGSLLIASLLGGHIQAILNNPVDLQAHIKAGTIRVLAAAGEQRIDDPLYENVPTFKEKGYDVLSILFQGFGAPKGIPEDVLTALRDGFERIAKDPEIEQAVRDLGLVPRFMNGKDFGIYWQTRQKELSEALEITGIMQIFRDQKK
jgi:tripartite-type tricarboxylate transporter receptor subunit TctC